MRRSFVRLVVTSVMVSWAVGFVLLLMYARSASWIEDRARSDGVFLARELLEAETPALRAERLVALRPHFSVALELVAVREVERRVGHAVEAGGAYPLRVSAREEWYFLVFNDAREALAAGPVNPTLPAGFVPMGAILGVIAIPLIAAWVVIRVNRELTKVERASQALAVGELSARVDNPHGPSNELAASFNAMAERVERLVRGREELVQAVSHELGSPLSRLRFQLELLESDGEEGRAERLTAMTRELDALDELVAELLGYVQSDELEIDPRPFDPRRALADLAELARLEVPDERDIEVEVVLADGASVLADPRLFQRAIENILRNAMRYTGGRVRLVLRETEMHVRVEVHDDGPGIPEDLREKVTVPFFRLDADRGRKTGGVGLGLAIVSRIMHRHGGTLEIGVSDLGGAQVAALWPVSS